MEQQLESAIAFLANWLHTNILTWDTAAQWACVGGAYAFALLIWSGIEKRLFRAIDEKQRSEITRQILRGLVDIGNVAGFIILIQICAAIFRSFEMHTRVLDAASDLAVAWIVIRLLTSIMANRSLAKLVTTVVWAVAALNIFGLLSPVTDFLHGLSFTVGETTFNVLGVIKGLALAAILMQIASLAVQFTTKRIESSKELSPSVRVLFAKTVKVLLYMGTILFAMSSVGIDLTSLAIFSSALGVGIGFGLKTVFSNYVAGILLLMDKSIKPGDTIEIGEVTGVVRDMHSRYASILTRDGTEHLIPNEHLISSEVINWTYSDRNVRLKVKVGISYKSDVEKALALIKEAAKGVKRVLKHPEPIGHLVGFGDSSVDLQLNIWISDADQGVTNVRGEVMINIWNLFHENGIEFPFPQRDVLLKPDSKLNVTVTKEDDNG